MNTENHSKDKPMVYIPLQCNFDLLRHEIYPSYTWRLPGLQIFSAQAEGIDPSARTGSLHSS